MASPDQEGTGAVRPKIKRRPSWCSCTMQATGRDGITRCCDCGRVTAYPTPSTAAPTGDRSHGGGL